MKTTERVVEAYGRCEQPDRDKALSVSADGGATIALPGEAPDKIDSVVVLEIQGPAKVE